MRWLELLAGVGLVLLTGIDAIWTTLWVEGHAGPVSRRFGRLASRGFGVLVARGDDRLLSLRGPLVLVLSIALWALLLWTGWTLVFHADPGALAHADSGAAADFFDAAYFAGYSISTLGNGDMVPRGPVWQLATGVAGLSGLVLLTLVVTYVLQILQAVVVARSLATQVHGLGDTAEQFVRRMWDGTSFRTGELLLTSLVEQLNLSTEQHQAYPMLHYYRSQHPRQAIERAVCVLDDALTLLTYGVAEEVRPAPGVLRLARSAVGGYLDTLEGAFVRRADRPPPALTLAGLRAAHILTVDDAAFAAAIDAVRDRRQLVLGLLDSEEREWPMLSA
ncbi:MAG TPA: potassium channel family protein [Gemmatimonadaceae bacterium]|nr:potassium channel family protein [Gemmatimonadaceae bacterium]